MQYGTLLQLLLPSIYIFSHGTQLESAAASEICVAKACLVVQLKNIGGIFF